MARLTSIGFELNTLTAAVELTGSNGAAAITIQTSTVRSGTYALKCASGGANIWARYQFVSANTSGAYFGRAYFNFSALPTQETTIMGFIQTTTTNFGCALTLDQNGTLKLYNGNRTATLVDTSASNLSTNTWYCLEIKYDKTQTAGSQILQARIDQGTAFGATNLTITNAVAELGFGHGLDGVNDAAGDTSAQCFIDDIAINDNTGSFQTSYPGAGSIVHLRPNADGDNHVFGTQSGVGDANNYTHVNEVTPDDGTGYIQSKNAGDIDDYNIDDTPAALNSGSTINCVQIGFRFATPVGSPFGALVVRVKASAGGTVEENSNVVPVAAFSTNAPAIPHNYPLTLYDLPGASTTVWTKSDLDSSQIGARITTGSTNNIRVSTIWMLVDYTPSVVATGINASLMNATIAQPLNFDTAIKV